MFTDKLFPQTITEANVIAYGQVRSYGDSPPEADEVCQTFTNRSDLYAFLSSMEDHYGTANLIDFVLADGTLIEAAEDVPAREVMDDETLLLLLAERAGGRCPLVFKALVQYGHDPLDTPAEAV